MELKSKIRGIADENTRKTAEELVGETVPKEGSDVFLVFFQDKRNPVVLDLLYHLYMVSDLSKEPVQWKLKYRMAARGLGEEVMEYGIGICSSYPGHTATIKDILGIDHGPNEQFFLKIV